MKYRKKPIIIEAFQWTGAPDQPEDPTWIVEAIERGYVKIGRIRDTIEMWITDSSGHTLKADIADWIIKDAEGRIYPCSPSIFKATYEPAGLEVKGDLNVGDKRQ